MEMYVLCKGLENEQCKMIEQMEKYVLKSKVLKDEHLKII